MLTLLTVGRFERKAGGVFLLGIALWAIARAAVATTWRNPAVLGPLNMGQVLALAVAAGMLRAAGAQRGGHVRRPDAPVDEPAAVDAPDGPDRGRRSELGRSDLAAPHLTGGRAAGLRPIAALARARPWR